MNSGQDIVVTSLNISQKEQQLKQRFLSNSRPETTVKAALVSAPDPAFNSFLDEIQNTLKQQAHGSVSSDLLKQQATIMHQQAELIREEQKTFQQVIRQMSKPQSEDPKRVLAELLAPLNKQIIDVKNYYEETKNSAKEIMSQVSDFKKILTDHRSSESLQKNVGEGMNAFAKKKALFESKIREAENMVSEVVADAEDRLSIGGCKQGIDYLRQQIEMVRNDTEKIEIELQSRYQRMMQQVQKVKSLPSEEAVKRDPKASEERISSMLGGNLDYDEILAEVESITNYRNALVQEFRKGTPVYPKAVRPVVTQITEKKVQKKPLQMHPVPVGLAKKTFKTKPNALQNIPTQPKQFIVKPKSDRPKSLLERVPEEIPQKSSVPTPREVPSKPLPHAQSLAADPISPPNEPLPSSRNKPSDFVAGPIPRAASPEAFQTRPGMTKGEQTVKHLTFPEIYPSLKNIETQEPPKSSLEQRTVDAVTEYVLTQLIQSNPAGHKKAPEPQSSRWLGLEELSELTRLGIYADPMTLERLGKEVLSQGIKELKMNAGRPRDTHDSERPSAALVHEELPVRSTKKPEVALDEPEEKYDSDFEASSSDNVPRPSENPERLFDKISPRTPPKMFEKRFENAPQSSIGRVISHPEANLHSLLDPRLLGMMSATSIQHYLSSLIEAGHLPKPQDTPSFFTRSPSPGTQPVATPQYNKLTSDTTIMEPKVPEEFKDFMSSAIGAQIFNTVKSNPHMSPQQVMESWVHNRAFSNKYPPQQEIPHPRTEAGVFGRPLSRGARVFDLDSEEKKVFEESSIARKMINIPVLEIHKKNESSDSYRLVTDSEVSGLSNSGSVGSEIFNIENPEFMGGFMEFVRKARELEEGQVPGNSDLSEGEVRMDYEGLSSGEIPREVMQPMNFTVEKNDRVRVSMGGLFSDEGYELSEGEFDPNSIFKA